MSRWELLQQMASGTPTDAALFAAPGGEGRGATGIGGRAAAALKDQLRRLGNTGKDASAAAAANYQGLGGVLVLGVLMLHLWGFGRFSHRMSCCCGGLS